MGTLGASANGEGYYSNHGVTLQTNANQAMTDYDRMPRPVPEDQRTPMPFHLSQGYRKAVARLEATHQSGLAEVADIAKAYEDAHSERRKVVGRRTNRAPY